MPNSPRCASSTWRGVTLCCAGCLQLTGSMCSHYSLCLAFIWGREIKGKGALLCFRLDGMQTWSKITAIEGCALFCPCWLVVFDTAWSIPGTYVGRIYMLKYKCRCGFYEQWTKVSKFTGQNKTLSLSIWCIYSIYIIGLNLYSHWN